MTNWHTGTGYNCHREERAAGFKHGAGVRKFRQDWNIGEMVSVGFVRGLMVVRKNADGSFALVSSKGDKYAFQPHRGLFREN